MKYLFLIYTDVQPLATLLPSQRSLMAEAERSNDDWLRASGRLLAGAPLQASSTVTTVGIQQSVITLTVGPLLESARHLSAFYLIDARDLNEAIQVATQMVQVCRDPIEIWPISE